MSNRTGWIYGPMSIARWQADDRSDLCPHIDRKGPIGHACGTEDDSFGPVGRYVCCEECYRAAREQEAASMHFCHDCSTSKRRDHGIMWRWYDFYAAQGDEPLFVCHECVEGARHTARVRQDDADRDAELGWYDAGDYDCDDGDAVSPMEIRRSGHDYDLTYEAIPDGEHPIWHCAIWGRTRLGQAVEGSDVDFFASKYGLSLRGCWRVAALLVKMGGVLRSCGVGWPLIQIDDKTSLAIIPFSDYCTSEVAYRDVISSGRSRPRRDGEDKIEYYTSLHIPTKPHHAAAQTRRDSEWRHSKGIGPSALETAALAARATPIGKGE